MANSLRSLVGILRRATGPDGSEPTDGELLRRFSESRDEHAFALLVGRHGPLVFGVCRRILGDHHHSEDAFQACFLVLANHAPRLVAAPSVAGWLHQVAVRIGQKARTRLARAARRDRGAAASHPEAVTPPEGAGLDEEVNRLPPAYRDALMMCYLQGHTVEEAAALLGCSADGLRGRLYRGKEMLRERLRRDPPALVPAVLSARLTETTLAALSAPTATAASLANGVIWTMFLTRLIFPVLMAGLFAAMVPLAVLAAGQADRQREAPGIENGVAVADDPEPPIWVRELRVGELPADLSGGNKLRVFKNSKEVTELGGREASAEVKATRTAVGKEAKFGREDVILVGNDHGQVKYKIDQKRRVVEFYIDSSRGQEGAQQLPNQQPGQVEGQQQLKIVPNAGKPAAVGGPGGAFFAVPAGVKVKWGGVREE